jgi:hypothetical protein
MTPSEYYQFLSECIAADPDTDAGLSEDEMYGLYISWCFLRGVKPQSSKAFWRGMSGLGIRTRRRVDRCFIRPGLRMTGPAAADYILARRPFLT